MTRIHLTLSLYKNEEGQNYTISWLTWILCILDVLKVSSPLNIHEQTQCYDL